MSLKEDLREFLKIRLEEIDFKLTNNHQISLDDWKNKKSIEGFYKTTECYLFGLLEFNTDRRVGNLLHPIKGIENKKILDYGAGIGIFLSILSDNNDCYYYDVESKTKDFAIFLAKKHNKKITFLTKEQLKEYTYDIIICTDVLEHLERPLETMEELISYLSNDGLILTTGLFCSYGNQQPMHLLKSIEKKFDLVSLMDKEFKVIFFHATPEENIFLYKRGKK